MTKPQPSLVWISGGSVMSRKGVWGAKININRLPVPFAEAEGSYPWRRKGGRRGPGLCSPFICSCFNFHPGPLR